MRPRNYASPSRPEAEAEPVQESYGSLWLFCQSLLLTDLYSHTKYESFMTDYVQQTVWKDTHVA
jgi:hypothetical protein